MTVAVVALAIASYMTLVTNENNTVARSQAWNQCIPVCESGIEEALTQIHYWENNFTATNNWTLGADGYYHKSRTNSDGSYCAVSIVPTNPPTIYATGYVVAPMKTSSSYVVRKVKVTTLRRPADGINAKGVISFSGNSTIDSFNSANPAYSTGGLYDSTKHEQNALVLTDSDAKPAIQISTGTIYGSVDTGPTGTVSVGGTITGTTANNANVQINDVQPPFTYGTGITPTNGSYNYNGTNYYYLLGTGNYNISTVSLTSGNALCVNGDAVLYVNGPFSIAGQSYIYIAPGGVLNMYINGTGSFAGGGIVNSSGYATNCFIYGLTNCTNVTYSGGAAFIGVMNAPDAAFSYSGGADFSGALTASTVTFSGGTSFHYDESLSSLTQVVASWNEF